MAISEEDIFFIEELFAPLGTVTHRKMMSGLTIYLEGQIFAILGSSGTIYLKAKGEFAALLAEHGAVQFGAETGKTMGYWTLPDDGLDDPETASNWARNALQNI